MLHFATRRVPCEKKKPNIANSVIVQDFIVFLCVCVCWYCSLKFMFFFGDNLFMDQFQDIVVDIEMYTTMAEL